MVQKKHLAWKFPLESFSFLRVESLFVVLIGILIFIYSFYGFDQRWIYALIATLVFIGIYTAISYLLQKIKKAETHYRLTPSHLEVTRKTRNKVEHDKVQLREIKHHKLDRLFLGGYLLTHKKKKHLLYFNTKEELFRFEKLLKEHLVPFRKKK